MNKTFLREWKKVYENDLVYISSELKESIDTPAVVILSGDVGVGKTTLTKIFSQDDTLASPTYSIVNESHNMVFADFYRLEKPEEIIHLELGLVSEGKEYIFIEWGMKFIKNIVRELHEANSFYEIRISMNPLLENHQQNSRNYELYSLRID